MVEADVAAEELEELRQLQVGAALQRGVGVAPALPRLPVGVLELVLDVEEEDAGDAGQHRGGHLDQQPVDRADRRDRRPTRMKKRDVGQPDAVDLARAHVLVPEARADHQRPERADDEEDPGAAEEPVGEAALPGARLVLGDGQRLDVALAAAVEVPGGAVVDGMVVAPVGERLEDEQAGDPADPDGCRAWLGRNEPWVQSWKTMKVRSRKPEVGIASARTSQG